MRLAFEELQREWLRASTVATPGLRQQSGLLESHQGYGALSIAPDPGSPRVKATS